MSFDHNNRVGEMTRRENDTFDQSLLEIAQSSPNLSEMMAEMRAPIKRGETLAEPLQQDRSKQVDQDRAVAKNVAKLIELLASPTWKGSDGKTIGREDAQRELSGLGPSAIPQLLQAVLRPNPELSRRADRAACAIAMGLTIGQLLKLRDANERERLIEIGLVNNLNAAEKKSLSEQMLGLANDALKRQLAYPEWLKDMNDDWQFFAADAPKLSVRTVAEWDRMLTPEGRRRAQDRIEVLKTALDSCAITKPEFAQIENQIDELNRVQMTGAIESHRFTSRISLAKQLDMETDIKTIRELMLQAYSVSPHLLDHLADKVVLMKLHTDPEFMSRFEKLTGAEGLAQTKRARQIFQR
jgi:hypothetical protein